MTAREELAAAIECLENVATELSLLAQSFRRLQEALDPQRRPDFDYRTGMPPQER